MDAEMERTDDNRIRLTVGPETADFLANALAVTR